MISAETNLAWVAASLEKGWEAAYAAFAGYLPPKKLDASPLRRPEQILNDLQSAPLRELSGNALGDYAMWAITTVGGVDEYKHYLPRILQHALLTPGEPGFDPLLILSRLEYARWHEWTTQEQSAVKDVLQASWNWARLQHPDELDAMNWFVSVVRLEKDISSLLEAWLANMMPNSALQLADIIRSSDRLPYGGTFWENLDIESRRTIASWLCSETLQTAVMAVVDGIADGDMWRIDSVEAALADMRATPWR